MTLRNETINKRGNTATDHDRSVAVDLQDKLTRRDTFQRLVCQYSEQLYWQARRIVRFHEDADDVVQNSFLKAWTHLDSYRGEASPLTWLTRIVINEALDHERRNKNNASQSDTSLADKLQADSWFDGDETQAMLEQAMEELPPVQRTVFHLRYYDEMPYQEMSEILGTSVGALKASYHHAVKKISDFFHARD